MTDRCTGTIDYLLNGLALHSAFFVALNRMKAMLYIKWKGVTSVFDYYNLIVNNQNDASFFLSSIIVSFIFSSHRIIDLFCFTDQYYMEVDFGAGLVFLPQIDVLDGVMLLLPQWRFPAISIHIVFEHEFSFKSNMLECYLSYLIQKRFSLHIRLFVRSLTLKQRWSLEWHSLLISCSQFFSRDDKIMQRAQGEIFIAWPWIQSLTRCENLLTIRKFLFRRSQDRQGYVCYVYPNIFRSFKAEKGLVITSCVSFFYYTMYYINNINIILILTVNDIFPVPRAVPQH